MFDKEKANRIELALCNIPIVERETVMKGAQNEVHKALAITTLSECKKVLDAIGKHQVSCRDSMMIEFLRENNNLLYPDWDEPDKMLHLKTKLMTVLASVSSAEVVAVKDEIDRRYAKASFFSSGQRDKAYRIELALCNTPLLERGNVISHEGAPNAVQQALASTRIWKKGFISLNEDNQIDISKRSSKTFTSIKSQFVAEDFQSQKSDSEEDSKPQP